jgi:hypothetical protein
MRTRDTRSAIERIGCQAPESQACHRRTHALRIRVTATLAALVANGTAWADPPPAVEITPNSIETPDRPMKIAIRGAPRRKLHVLVLRNCDHDWLTPEIAPRENCDPVVSKWSIELDDRGRWSERWQQMAEVTKKDYDKPLWLRVSPNQNGRWPYGDAMFTVVSDPCSVWDTLVDLFSDSECHADVQSTLRPQMGDNDERPAVALEARRLARDPATGTWARLTPVPGTRGATGVAWADARRLLVTLGRTETGAVVAGEEPSGSVQPGLYRIDVASGRRELLVSAQADEILAAPFAVRPGYMVFVRERTVAAEDGTVASLAVWKRGRVIRGIPLRQTIHQILAADPARSSVLAYSRWQGVPALLRIDLDTGAVTHLGFPAQLFHAVTRAPGGTHAVVAIPDNAGYNGWDLILVDGKGHLAEELAVGPGEDLMPAWRAGGMELVYLGQSEGRMEAP